MNPTKNSHIRDQHTHEQRTAVYVHELNELSLRPKLSPRERALEQNDKNIHARERRGSEREPSHHHIHAYEETESYMYEREDYYHDEEDEEDEEEEFFNL